MTHEEAMDWAAEQADPIEYDPSISDDPMLEDEED